MAQELNLNLLHAQFANREVSRSQPQPEPIESKLLEFIRDIKSFLAEQLGSRYESFIISDATQENEAKNLYSLTELTEQMVRIELHQGFSPTLTYRLDLTEASLQQNGQAADISQFKDFHRCFCNELEKVSQGKADTYKVKINSFGG